MSSDIEIKKSPAASVSGVLKKIYDKKLTTASGGNISVINNKKEIWITPAGIDKSKVKDTDIVCVSPDGKCRGAASPSSELPFHRQIYDARPDLKAVIHAHSPALITFSIIRKIPETGITPFTEEICGKPGYAEYGLTGSPELGKKIANAFASNKKTHSVILENHGVVTAGKDLSEAYLRFLALEFCAAAHIESKKTGLPALHKPALSEKTNKDKFFFHKPNTKSTAGPAAEMLRKEITETLKRALKRNLMPEFFGTVSARIDDNNFVITPPGINRSEINPEDLLQAVIGEDREKSAAYIQIHSEIYRQKPDIACIITTLSPALSAFTITEARFNTRIIPESWVFLKDVPSLPFNQPLKNRKDFSDTAFFIKNDSFTTMGKNIFSAFDRLEVAELTASALLDSFALGTLISIESEQIEELKRSFPV
ncbi:MAG: class II aldolase/adducin family protein [Fibrobacterota bacterium]